jgi:hypothetical protein
MPWFPGRGAGSLRLVWSGLVWSGLVWSWSPKMWDKKFKDMCIYIFVGHFMLCSYCLMYLSIICGP